MNKGQSLVEFALTLPIILMLAMGIVDLGFIIHAQVQVSGASYEGARVGSLFVGNVNDLTTQNDGARATAIRSAVSNALGLLDTTNPQNFDPSSDVQITYYPNSPSNSTRTGDEVLVTVRYRQPVWFSLLAGISNGRYAVSSSTRIRIQ